MPTLTLVLKTPHDNGSATSGTIDTSERSSVADDARSSIRIGESITANARARAVAQAKMTDIIDVDAPTLLKKLEASMELTKVRNKKRKSSILEQLNYNADADDDDDKKLPAVEKENSKMAAYNSTSNAKKTTSTSTKKKATSTKKTKTKPPTKTLLNFFSSNKPSTHTSGDESAKKTDVENDNEDEITEKKKRKKRSTVKLNEKAKPIDVHIAFAGEEKRTSIVIKKHCVASKYDMGKKPLVLNQTYPAESKRDIENFLSGFGKYCM